MEDFFSPKFLLVPRLLLSLRWFQGCREPRSVLLNVYLAENHLSMKGNCGPGLWSQEFRVGLKHGAF